MPSLRRQASRLNATTCAVFTSRETARKQRGNRADGAGKEARAGQRIPSHSAAARQTWTVEQFAIDLYAEARIALIFRTIFFSATCLTMPEHRPTVVALGELLWDKFPEGARFGGAPMNFAHHACQFGADCWVVTAVGEDDFGSRALDQLRRSHVHVDHVAVHPTLPTGSVDVKLDEQGVASYHFHELEAWDDLKWSEQLQQLAERCDAVCFGTLGQRNPTSRETITRFVQSTPASTLRVLDLNLRPPYYDQQVIGESLRLANTLKLNEDELQSLAKHFELTGNTEVQQSQSLANTFELQLVAVTRGSRGSLLVRDGQIDEVDAPPTEVMDTVGAGDSFTAAVIMGSLAGESLESINRLGATTAAYVCTQSGATPSLPDELRRRFNAV